MDSSYDWHPSYKKNNREGEVCHGAHWEPKPWTVSRLVDKFLLVLALSWLFKISFIMTAEPDVFLYETYSFLCLPLCQIMFDVQFFQSHEIFQGQKIRSI